MKQNVANSTISPPKNGGLKAWSLCVRKANTGKQNKKIKDSYLYLLNNDRDSSSKVFLREVTSFTELRSGGAGSTELYGLELSAKILKILFI